MSIKKVLLPDKLDLDVMLLTLLGGIRAGHDNIRFLSGSASGADLADPEVLCVEVGGTGRVADNNFDHHSKAGEAGHDNRTELSAAAQFFERVARLLRYVDDHDRGEHHRVSKVGFPSLVQLVSGMLLVVKEPERRLEAGHQVLRAVLQVGLDPNRESMERILDLIPDARIWATAKKVHEAHSQEVVASARWFETIAGHKLAVVETTWIGAPGALQGSGADIVIALNPAMQRGDSTIAKYTVAADRISGISVRPVLDALEALEIENGGKGGWGGPNHGTIIGSPQDHSSAIPLDKVVATVQHLL